MINEIDFDHAREPHL